MARSVGGNTPPGSAVASFLAKHPRVVVVAFVLFVCLATQGATAAPAPGPASTGVTNAGP